MNRRDVILLVVTLLGLLLDQGSKWWVIQTIPFATGEVEIIPGLLSLVHAHNPGAAFGLLRSFEYRHWVFLAFTMVAVGVIIDMVRKLPTSDTYMATTMGLILSGALGNAIDRVRLTYVTDFIRVYTDQPEARAWLIATFGTNEWPSFNIADAALVVGVLMFIFHQMFLDDASSEDKPKEEAPAS